LVLITHQSKLTNEDSCEKRKGLRSGGPRVGGMIFR